MLLVVLALAGCGGGDETASEPSTGPWAGEAASTEVVLSFDLDGEPIELDMHVFEADGEWAWVVGE